MSMGYCDNERCEKQCAPRTGLFGVFQFVHKLDLELGISNEVAKFADNTKHFWIIKSSFG